jgi:serine/threonine protein kinase
MACSFSAAASQYARGDLRTGHGGLLRSAVADYQVVEDLGRGRYAALAPERLRLTGADGSPGRVTVAELAIGSAVWAELTTSLCRFASVSSPHLLRLFEVGPDVDPDGAGVYLVTEAFPGGNLGSPSRELTRAEQVRAVAGAALGAHDLHESGVAHGSISPSVIYLTERGPVLGPGAGGPDGRVVAMRDWRDLALLDPDLLRGQPASRSSDIWALAASLYALIGPAPLYPGMVDDQPVTAVQRVLFSHPEVSPSTPDGLADVLGPCFDADPARRPQTAAELSERLLACVGPE